MTKNAAEKDRQISPAGSAAAILEIIRDREDRPRSGKIQGVEYTSITRLPNTPSCMKGIIDLRGEITTIIDLEKRIRFFRKSKLPVENSSIIIPDEKLTKARTGILVDDVPVISTFGRGDVNSTSVQGAKKDSAILGIIKKKLKENAHRITGMIIWIDIRHLLVNINPDNHPLQRKSESTAFHTQ